MRRAFRSFVFCILVFKLAAADVFLTLELQSFSAGTGFLSDGVSHCDPFYFAGRKCNIRLKICVDDIKSTTNGFDTCSTAFVNLGQVTNNDNAITFENKWYGGWLNPMPFRFYGNFQGFQLKLIAQHFTGTDYKLIDEFVVSSTDSSLTGSSSINHTRSGLPSTENTLLQLAWVVTTGVPTAPTTPGGPTTAPPSHNCYDVYQHSLTDGDYNIQLSDGSTVRVYCDLSGGGWTVLQNRVDSATDFNRTFTDYENFFGDASGSYWIGLKNMKLLADDKQYSLKIDICCGNSSTSITYDDFKIGDASTNYKLTFGGNDGGAAGDGFNNSAFGFVDYGAKFATSATYDPNGAVPYAACPTIKYGGWWFGSCHNNLNGQAFDTAEYSVARNCTLDSKYPPGSGIIWNGLTKSAKTKARMKIIPTANKPPLDEFEEKVTAFCTA